MSLTPYTRFGACAGVLASALIGGCGGGDSTSPPPPPPPPSAASVTVSPNAAALAEGDTVRLAATVRDRNGAVMTGEVVTWSSNATPVATVSAGGTVTAVGAGSATITATAGAATGTAAISVAALPKVVLDPSGAPKTIGVAGGSVTAVSAAGVNYELTVPPLALDSAVVITLTPLKAFNRLPLSGGLVGAVEFQPAGLRFRAPATLVIKTAPNVPAGQRLVGFGFGTGGDSLTLRPAALAGGQVTVLVSHFSGAGAALGTVQDLAALPPAPNSSAQDTALVALAGLALPADGAAILSALRRWQAAIVLRLQSAQSDVAVRDGRGEYAAWLGQLAPFGATVRATLAPELGALRTALTAAYGRGIGSANQQCVAQQSFLAARNVLFLQAMAAADSVAGPGSPAERSTVLTGLCIHPVVVDSLYPVNPAAGVTGSLDLRVGFQFAGAPPTLGFMPAGLAIDVHGSTADRAVAVTTDPQGRFSLAVTPTGSAPLTMAVQACPTAAAFGFDYPCVSFTLSRAFGRTITGNVVVQTQAQLAPLADVVRITGNLTISGAAITSTSLAELQQLQSVDGSVSLTTTPSIQTLAGLRNLTRIGGSLTVSLPQLTTLAGLDGLTAVGGTLRLANMPNVATLAGLAAIRSVGALDLIGLAAVTTVAPLGQLTFGSLVVQRLGALTTLGGLAALGTSFGGSIRLVDNAKLADLDRFQGLTSIGGVLEVRGSPLLADLDAFTALTAVGGDLTIGGAGLVSVSGLAHIATVGGTLTLVLGELDALNRFELPLLTSIGAFRTEQQRTGNGAPNPVPMVVQFGALTRVTTGQVGTNGGTVATPRFYDLIIPAFTSIGASASNVGLAQSRGLQNLTIGSLDVAVVVNIDLNPDLRTLKAGDVRAGSVLNLDLNPSLLSVDLGNLTADIVNIDNNPKLASLHLANVHAATVLNVDNNAVLTTVQWLQLNAGVVNIDNNALGVLTFNGGIVGLVLNIDHNSALSALAGSITVTGDLNVDNNPSLPNAAATSWANSISVGGKRNVSGNKP